MIEDLKKIPHIWFLKTQEVARRGVPDLLICISGKFVAIELKSKAGKPDKLQLYKGLQITAAGGSFWVAYPDNWSEVLTDLKRLSRWEMK